MVTNYPYYQNYYQPQPQQGSGIVWVQGEAGAKSYLVGAGQSVLLMDAEGSCFYIKSTDPSGMPMPLRVFDYKERAQSTASAPAAGTEFVTREEFNAFKKSLEAEDAKPVV